MALPTVAFAKFRALAPAERRVVLVSLLLLPLLSIALRIAPRRGLQCARGRPMEMPARARSLDPARTAALVCAVAGRLPLRSTCLARSLFVQWLLRRQGTSSDVNVGVRFSGGRLEAHAWVECDGQPLCEMPDVRSRYHAFTEPFPVEALFRR